jgi:hypothetical protein
VEDFKITFELFPQPAFESLNISSTHSFDKLEILKTTGESVLALNKPQRIQNISVSEWSNGNYVLRLTEGTHSVSRLFVVKH